MNKFVIIEFDLATAAIIGYWNGSPDNLTQNINEATVFDTRDDVRYELGTALKDRPNREFQYRQVTQSLVLVP